MTRLTVDDLSGLQPTQFVELLRNTPDSDLKAAMTGSDRTKILDAIFHRMPTLFRADLAGSTSAVIHWNLTGGRGGETNTYQIAINDGTCTVSHTLDQNARLAVTLGGTEFLKLISGKANPALMFMTGKLRARGDLGLATSVMALFEFPES